MKKVIKLFFLASIFNFSFFLGFSQEKQKEGDTLKIKWKNSRIWIFDDEDKPKDTAFKKAEPKRKNFTHWAGIDIGFCMLTTASNQSRLPQEENVYNTNYFLDLKYERSLYVSFNPIEKNIKLYKNYVYFVPGLGIEWNAYNFRNKITLPPDSSVNSLNVFVDTSSSVRYIKNQLKAAYIKAPFLLEFNTNNTNPGKSFHFAAGIELDYKIDSWTKQKTEKNNYIYKVKRHDDYNLASFKYGIVVRAGYGRLTLFVNYAFSPLFKKEHGPEIPVYPLSAGIAIY
jgi:hypothetical protein